MRVSRISFRAMGTSVSLTGPTEPIAFGVAGARVRRVFRSVEARFSRFRADSELAVVNGAAGAWIDVSPPFAALLCLALDGAARTEGLFDPTILPALSAAGYDRDLDVVRRGALPPRRPAPAARWREVEVRSGAVRLPPGAALDFGGLAKGVAVDLAATAAAGRIPWAMVEAGGDLRVAGRPPADGLPVRLEDPLDATAEILRLVLDAGALATTSVTRRAWGPGLHHVIDPRTGRPAATGVLQATVWAATCAEAEVWAKWALLTGPSAVDAVPGVLVTEDGRVRVSVPRSADAA